MGRAVTFQPSRTFALAAFGLLALVLMSAGLFIALAWSLTAETIPPELPGHLVQALQVVAGCVATVATAGAGSMAARDYASRGLTSSAGATVLASRSIPREPPQAAKPPTETEDLGGE